MSTPQADLPTETAALPELGILQMRVVWRDTFIVEHPPHDFLGRSRDALRALPCTVSDSQIDERDQPDLLRIINRVSRSVAVNGHADLLRVQLQPLQIANLRPTLARWRCRPDQLTPEQIKTAAVEADAGRDWIEVTPILLLHRAGVGMVSHYAAIRAPYGEIVGSAAPSAASAALPRGFTPDEAIELVRLGIQTQLLSLDETWRQMIPVDAPDWYFYSVIGLGPSQHLAIGGLRDLSQVVAAHVSTLDRKPRRRPRPLTAAVRPARPTGSTTVVIVGTNPPAGREIASFVQQYAAALRGIGALDNYYRERARWIVERELGDDLSSDNESAVYLLGNSELILFNDQLPDIAHNVRRRLGLRSDELAITYVYMHYGVLLEWVYLQDAILRSYLHRLDALAATSPLRRREMIATLHGALADLIQYQEDITPYATRIEFLERARAYHKLDKLGERLERKQDLLLTYSSEYQDYREASAAEFLNWLAAVLAGGELGSLITSVAGISPTQNTPLYLIVTLGCIALVFAVMIVLRVLRGR